jgi:hypothetical protein
MVRPWKAFSMTMMVGTSIPLPWPYIRASLIAASLASQPELQKNARSMPESAQSLSASSSWRSTR